MHKIYEIVWSEYTFLQETSDTVEIFSEPEILEAFYHRFEFERVKFLKNRIFLGSRIWTACHFSFVAESFTNPYQELMKIIYSELSGLNKPLWKSGKFRSFVPSLKNLKFCKNITSANPPFLPNPTIALTPFYIFFNSLKSLRVFNYQFL